MARRIPCLRCWARIKPGKPLCPKCHKVVVRRVEDRFELTSCIAFDKEQAAFLAYDLESHREVFLRVARPAAKPDVTDGLAREARVLRDLYGTEGIPAFVKAGRASETGAVYTVQEFVPGPSLEEAWAKAGLSERVDLLRDCIPPVATLHRLGFVHCALSPRHFRLSPEGRVYLLDYRQARQASEPSGGSGIPGYASPEQWNPMRAVTPATDVFAMGACLYRGLTGAWPYGKRKPNGTPARVAPPRNPSQASRDLTPDLDGVVLRALAYDPENRHPSLEDFHHALTGDFGSDTVPDAFDFPFPSRLRLAARAVGNCAAGVVMGGAMVLWGTVRGVWSTAGAAVRLAQAHPRLALAGAAIPLTAVPLCVLAWHAPRLPAGWLGDAPSAASVTPSRSPAPADWPPHGASALQVLTWPPAKVYCNGTYFTEAPGPDLCAVPGGELGILLVSARGGQRHFTIAVRPGKAYVLEYNFDTGRLNLKESAS